MIEAALYGLGATVVLELLYLLLRRSRSPVRVRALYHLWAVATGAAVTLSVVWPDSTRWKVAASIASLLTALVLFSLLDSLVFQRPWSPQRGPMMPKLARDVLRVVVLAAAVLVIATLVLRQPLPAVLVSSTVLSAVIGLALQDVLKNVFAGMALELEHPVARGDWVLLDGQTVQVIDTSWRSVRLRTRDGVDLWEPNSTFSTERIVNYGSGARPIGINFLVNLGYDAPPTRVKAALLAAARSVPEALSTPAPEAFLQRYGESAIEYRLRVWTQSLADLSRFSDGVNGRIWHELRRRNLDVPFPQRSVLWRDAERTAEQLRERRAREIVALLREVRLFSQLDDEALAQLAAAARHQHYDHGEVLVREGEQGDSLFVLERGRVQVTKSGSDVGTGWLTLGSIEEGGFFGEMSLLTGEPRSATVTADGGAEIVVLSKEALAPLLVADPQLAERLTSALVARQAKTAASLEGRRDRRRDAAATPAESNLLQRIRSFFKLPGG